MELQYVFGNPRKGVAIAKANKKRDNKKQGAITVKKARKAKKAKSRRRIRRIKRNPFKSVATKKIGKRIIKKTLGTATTASENRKDLAILRKGSAVIKHLTAVMSRADIPASEAAQLKSKIAELKLGIRDGAKSLGWLKMEGRKLLGRIKEFKKTGWKVKSYKISDKKANQVRAGLELAMIKARKAEKGTVKKAPKGDKEKSVAKKRKHKKASKKKYHAKKKAKKAKKHVAKKHSKKRKHAKKISHKKVAKKARRHVKKRKHAKKKYRHSHAAGSVFHVSAKMRRGAVKSRKHKHGKKRYTSVMVRHNPGGQVMNKVVGQIKNYFASAGSIEETAYLVGGAALVRPITGLMMKAPVVGSAMTWINTQLSKFSPQAASMFMPMIPSTIAGIALELASDKLPGKAGKASKELAKALLINNLVSLGASLGAIINSELVKIAPSLFAGVQFTPTNGVDFTPTAGIPDLRGADFGGADFGSNYSSSAGVLKTDADFGGVDFTPTSGAHDMDMQYEEDEDEAQGHMG